MSHNKVASSPAAMRAARKGKLPAPSLTTSRDALLTEGSDHAFRQLVHALLAFLARHETVRDNHAAAVGLSGVEYTVLASVQLLSETGQVSVRELAAHLHLSGAFVTTVSNKLQAMGLLDKLTDPADRRRLRLVLTPPGETRLAQLDLLQRDINDVQFDCLGQGDLPRLLASIDKLVESSDRAIALQKYLQPPGLSVAGPSTAKARSRIEPRSGIKTPVGARARRQA